MKDESKTKKQLIEELNKLRFQQARAEKGLNKLRQSDSEEGETKSQQHAAAAKSLIYPHLRNSRYLRNISDEALQKFLDLTAFRHFIPGEIILSQNQKNHEVFILTQGAVSVQVDGELIYNLVRKGDIFGEMSVITGKPSTATIKAVDEVETVVISSQFLKKITGNISHELNHIFYEWFSQILAGKLNLTTQKAMQASEETSEHKQKEEDLQQRLTLESHLRHAHKMEALGTLTGGIAHEFNNLLAPILGYTDLIMRTKSAQDPDMQRLVAIQTAGNRAKDLVQQMLAFGRKSFSQKASLPLKILLEDVIKLIKNMIPPNIEIEKQLKGQIPPVLGMPNEIHQVLLNLCLNAIQAMPAGGVLTIRLTHVGFQQFMNSEGQKKEGDYINLQIHDTGIGMDPTTLERIFDPFFTTKEVGTGTGLGLSVALGIVEQHEGHIAVESHVGVGTTVDVYLPASETREDPVTEKIQALPQGNEHILLIDDDAMIVDLMQGLLEELGYHITTFLDGTEALQWFQHHPQDVDLVLTDYGMPKMNGKQLATQLKRIHPDLPIILLTGYGDLVAKEDIHSWGMEDLLIKPFDIEKLSKVTRKVLDKQRQSYKQS